MFLLLAHKSYKYMKSNCLKSFILTLISRLTRETEVQYLINFWIIVFCVTKFCSIIHVLHVLLKLFNWILCINIVLVFSMITCNFIYFCWDVFIFKLNPVKFAFMLKVKKNMLLLCFLWLYVITQISVK